MLRYEEEDVVRRLAAVDARARTAFAAACAQRLLPAYETYCTRTGRKGFEELARFLDALWTRLVRDNARSHDASKESARCEELIPRDDEQPWVVEQVYADDAAAALAYAIRAEGGEPQEAG